MKAKWFIQFVFVSLVVLILASLSSYGTTVNAQATKQAAPPAGKMRWDIVSNTVKDGKPNVDVGGVASASANDGSYLTLKGSGTFGPGITDPVTGGGEWATFDAGNTPTGNGKYTVTAFAGYEWGPGQVPAVVVDNIGKNADAAGGVATLRIAYSNADGTLAGTGFLIISCHVPAGAPSSIVEGIVVVKGYVLFYNPTHIVPGVDQGRNLFHFVH